MTPMNRTFILGKAERRIVVKDFITLVKKDGKFPTTSQAKLLYRMVSKLDPSYKNVGFYYYDLNRPSNIIKFFATFRYYILKVKNMHPDYFEKLESNVSNHLESVPDFIQNVNILYRKIIKGQFY